LVLLLAASSEAFGAVDSVTSESPLQKQYNYSMKLYYSEKYFDAVTEFKRLLFFDKQNEYVFKANRQIAECYKKGGKYSDAILHYKIAEKAAQSRDDFYKIKIDVIRTNILRRSTERAFELLNELERDTNSIIKKTELDYWRGWGAIFNDEWEKGAGYFDKCDKNHPLKILAQKVENEKYSVTFARLISVFFPGAGQFYTGNYVSGIMSLGWNFLWGYISVNSFVENRVFDGVMTANFLWLRFYTGNVQNAEKFAEMKNSEIINNTLLYLQNNYIGEKP
jgi:TM2 domain-containing membrane protein YozV